MSRTNENSRINRSKALALLSGQAESTDILRVLAKVRVHMDRASINPIFAEMNTDGIEPSDMNIMECVRTLAEYVNAHASEKHPIYTLDVLLEKYDVAVSETGVSYIDVTKEKENQTVSLPTTMGILTPNPADVVVACAATLLSYTTSESEKGIDNIFKDSEKLTLMRMPKINGIDIRGVMKTSKKSPAVSRDIIYEQLKGEKEMGLLLMGKIFSISSYHHKSEKVKTVAMRIKNKMNKELAKSKQDLITYEPDGASPGVFKVDYTFGKTPKLYSLHASKFIVEQTIGSTSGKRGGLTAGYYYMETTPALAKSILRAKELLALAKEFEVSRVRLPSHKDYGANLIRILMRNKIIVISDAGQGADKGDIGHYRTTKEQCLNVLITPFGKPTWSKKGVVWNDKGHEDNMEFFLSQSPCTVSSVYLTPLIHEELLVGEKIHLHPGLFPHACRIWISNTKTRFTKNTKEDMETEVNDNIERMASALFSRVKFPLTRRPFFSSDKKRKIFDDILYLPKVDRKLKNDMASYTIDASEVMIDDSAEAIFSTFVDKYDKVESQIPKPLSIEERADVAMSYIFFEQDQAERFARFEIYALKPENKDVLAIIVGSDQIKPLLHLFKTNYPELFPADERQIIHDDLDDEEYEEEDDDGADDLPDEEHQENEEIDSDEEEKKALEDVFTDMGDVNVTEK